MAPTRFKFILSPPFSCDTMEEKFTINYDSNLDKILLVGEGDFSFALSLARKFGTAKDMVATSLDSIVDVHTMSVHQGLQWNYFNLIVFNYPHAGFTYRECDPQQIELHKKLVRAFFRSAKFMIKRSGLIHVTHKRGYPFSEWKIKELALLEGLIFIREE
ncbi:unnamed protein product [Lupinus luteus]|uniref:25S rRNA (uridine-N(3))-methyltransferase BMT5-like domain-containing protein n=1 Tax=Lupinus luteus TaxID=3873 RepID=A0AAV1XRN0_LUPLU